MMALPAHVGPSGDEHSLATAGPGPLCCQPTPRSLEALSREQLVRWVLVYRDRATASAEHAHKLELEHQRQLDELEQTREQMLAYAQDLRSAFRAERSRRAELERAYLEAVRTMASAIDARDPYTGGHVERVAQYAVGLGRELGWSEADLRVLEVGALLHDVGKIGVNDAILRKPSSLDEAEWAIMRQHPEIGAALLNGLHSMRSAVPAVLHHHERYDGKGYPHGLVGSAIPAVARVVTVADAFDAMLTDRPYRKGLPLDGALEEIERHAGTQFDPIYAQVFVQCVERGKLRVLAGSTPTAA
jgi:HD-GYP domain-containing protein (c-di-GMP phosphodiesterase class II)